MNKSQIIDTTEYIDTALFEGGFSPEYGKTLIKTNIFLRQQLNKEKCEDCGESIKWTVHMADGKRVCKSCLRDWILKDKEEWEMKRNAIIN